MDSNEINNEMVSIHYFSCYRYQVSKFTYIFLSMTSAIFRGSLIVDRSYLSYVALQKNPTVEQMTAAKVKHYTSENDMD